MEDAEVEQHEEELERLYNCVDESSSSASSDSDDGSEESSEKKDSKKDSKKKRQKKDKKAYNTPYRVTSLQSWEMNDSTYEINFPPSNAVEQMKEVATFWFRVCDAQAKAKTEKKDAKPKKGKKEKKEKKGKKEPKQPKPEDPELEKKKELAKSSKKAG